MVIFRKFLPTTRAVPKLDTIQFVVTIAAEYLSKGGIFCLRKTHCEREREREREELASFSTLKNS